MRGIIITYVLVNIWGMTVSEDKVYTKDFVLNLVQRIDRLEQEFSLFKKESSANIQELQTKLRQSDQRADELENRLEKYQDRLEKHQAFVRKWIGDHEGPMEGVNPLAPEQQNSNNTNHDRIQRLLIPSTPDTTPQPSIHPVAFYAHASGHQTGLGTGQTIHYKTVITNAGNGFDPKVGIFRAPTAGYYYFATTLVSGAGETVRSNIVHNSQDVAHVFAGNEATYGSGSNSVVLHLNVNDDVWTRVFIDSNAHVFPDSWCTFSGFLISN